MMKNRSVISLPGALGFTFCSLLAISVLEAQSTPAQAPATAAPTSKSAEQEFKNIQALKGVPADQIFPAMQFIAASLGVECEYCHVEHAFDKDDKKQKVTARKMMGMMMAINKENFEGHREVTCYSCHRGSSSPVGTPLIGPEEGAPGRKAAKESSERQTDLPSADQLLDKYLAAVGGAQALEKTTSRVQKGTLTGFGGQQFAMEIYSKAPDKRISTMHLKDGDSITAFDGQRGWLGVPGRVHRMTAAENDAARIDADLYFALHVKRLFQKFRVEAGEKISGQDTYLVAGSNEGQPPLQLYLDKETGLLLRLVRYADTPLGRNPTQIDYADYRDTDGVKIPFRWTLARPGNRFTIQIDQVQQNVPVEEGKFATPPETPPPAKPQPK
jgi:photosynthetic reaction center cytochrome c subunit